MKKTAAQLANYVLYKSGATPGYDAMGGLQRSATGALTPEGRAAANAARAQQSAIQSNRGGFNAMGGYQRSATGTLTQAGRAAATAIQPQEMAQNQTMRTQPAPSTGGYQGVQFVGDAASDMRETPNVKITRRGGGGGHKPPVQAKPGAGTLAKGTAQGASSKSTGALGGIGTLAAGFTDPQSQQSVAFAPSKQRGNQAPAKPTSTLAQAKGKPRMRNMDFTTAGNFPDNYGPADQKNYLATEGAPAEARATGMTDATAFLRGAPGGGFNDTQNQQSVAFAPSKQRAQTQGNGTFGNALAKR